jgi:arylsulfatase A-like enzyme
VSTVNSKQFHLWSFESSHPPGLITVFVCVVALVLLAGCWVPQTVTVKPNLLLMTLDTTRADYLGTYGGPKDVTPNLDGLAAQGVTFEDTESAAPLTLPAHEAILTGRFPPHDGAVDNGVTFDLPTPTLAEILHERGYRTAAFVGSYVLHARWGLNRGFDLYDAPFTGNPLKPNGLRRSGLAVSDAALPWLAANASQPFFAWLHFYDAHEPRPSAGPSASEPYTAGIQRVDASVGRIIAALSSTQMLDRTVVVVLADHGESLGEHGEATHGIFLYESVIHVPLILRLPGGRASGLRMAGVSRSVDILPTVLALLGFESPGDIDGVNLAPYITHRRYLPALDARAETDYPRRRYGWSPLRAIRVDRYKAVDAPLPELYDLASDPQERRNIASVQPTVLATLLNRLRKPTESPSTLVKPARPDLASRVALASLGYVSASVDRRHDGVILPDPKNEIGSLKLRRDREKER